MVCSFITPMHNLLDKHTRKYILSCVHIHTYRHTHSHQIDDYKDDWLGAWGWFTLGDENNITSVERVKRFVCTKRYRAKICFPLIYQAHINHWHCMTYHRMTWHPFRSMNIRRVAFCEATTTTKNGVWSYSTQRSLEKPFDKNTYKLKLTSPKTLIL